MDMISRETLERITDRFVAGIQSSLQFAVRDAAAALDGFELTFTIKLSKIKGEKDASI